MIRALTLLIALFALWASSAGAQGSCGDRAVMVKKLSDRYGEVQMGAGLAGTLMLEIWANCQTGTWSVLKTHANGTACLMAAGQDWQGVGCEPGQNT